MCVSFPWLKGALSYLICLVATKTYRFVNNTVKIADI